jgi:membrane fusion protein, multidrug efflux system
MNSAKWAFLFPLFSLIGLSGCQEPKVEALARDATNVVIAQPTVSKVTDYEEFTGHTDAILSVQVKSRVTGYLLKKNFLDGDETHEGDVLYEIDDRPYKTALDSAESSVARGGAHLKRIQADFRRASNLFQRATIGKQEFDLMSSNFAEAQAALDAAKAARDIARLNMEFTKIRAPMSGQLSRTLVDPGNLVRQDVTILNDIGMADKLYVYFDLNEDSMQRVRGLIDQGEVGTAAGKEVPVLVGLSDEDEFPYKGLVNFSENKLDAATGTLRVRGIIDNPRPWVLSPGLFVRVRLPIGAPHPALLVRDEAVGSDQGRSFLYLVDRNDEVEYRPVEVGALYSGSRLIRKGLGQDERIIVDPESLRRVRPGAKVAPKVAPPNDAVASAPAKAS